MIDTIHHTTEQNDINTEQTQTQDRQAHIRQTQCTDSERYRHAKTNTYREMYRERERDRERDRARERKRERKRDTHTRTD